ncbi:MAG TPA: hypothetical protein PK105_03630 [Rectinema sp.]|nr:hypothetical protein [Rectinema sp.]HOU60830.1 hypothetical protein [Rectinema sp.]HPD69373.1 hypothetical protein [Rectinema sp.]HQJ22592.1 hypothetical protein [Rectinema sp.]HRS32260.1 hypothetical protein [Rectinema sp.]
MNLEKRLAKLEAQNDGSALDIFVQYINEQDEKKANALYKKYLRADPNQEIEEFLKIIDRRVKIAKKRSEENERLIANSEWRIVEDHI